ncbi:hypothetical protein GALL_490640 [mine drainage metagenome]|uniref:Uncharacterized protein n=1 Tax=mine drainage metagenome TaxID=410659 RepID=A0A1J5PDP4_9ZZZZ
MAFDQSGPRWLGISDLIAEPEGPTFISYKVARRRLDRLRFVTQDPKRNFFCRGCPHIRVIGRRCEIVENKLHADEEEPGGGDVRYIHEAIVQE